MKVEKVFTLQNLLFACAALFSLLTIILSAASAATYVNGGEGTIGPAYTICLGGKLSLTLGGTTLAYNGMVNQHMSHLNLGPGFIATGVFGILSALSTAGFAVCKLKGFEKALIKEPNNKEGKAQEKETRQELEKVELLKKYKDLYDTGVITQEEFEVKRLSY